MDARSRLNDINCFIEKKLKNIQGLKLLDVHDDLAQVEYQRHQTASRLFYYCLIAAYGNLAVKARLDRMIDSKTGELEDRYKHYDGMADHELCEAERLVDGYAKLRGRYKDSISENKAPVNTRADVRKKHGLLPLDIQEEEQQQQQQAKTELGKRYVPLVAQFKAELDNCKEDKLSALFFDHLQDINLALMRMAFAFVSQHKENMNMRSFVRRRLVLAAAVDFVFEMQHETRRRVLKKLKHLAGKDLPEVKFFQKIFSDDEVGDQGIKIKTEHPFSGLDLFKKLKEMIDLDAADDETFENLFLVFKEKCKNYGIGHPSHLKKTPDEETVDRVSQKLSLKLEPLKARYLSEFDRIEAMVEAVLDDKQPVPQDGRLAGYVNHLRGLNKPALTPAPARLRSETAALDQQINSVLDELDTTTTDRSALLGENRNRSNSTQTPVQTPALSRKRSQSHLGSLQEGVYPSIVGAAPETLPTSQAIIPPPSARAATSLTGGLHDEFIVRRSETAPFQRFAQRPDPAVFQSKEPKPSILKYILIGAGIGFLIAGGVALSVWLAFAFAPSAPLALTLTFATATKLLATTAIGTWSAVAAVLASPPIIGFCIALGVWRRKCGAIVAPIITPVTKALGSTRSFFESFHVHDGFHSEPVRRPSVEMSASEKFRRAQHEAPNTALPTIVGNPSTRYSQAVSPTPGAVEPAPKVPGFRPE